MFKPKFNQADGPLEVNSKIEIKMNGSYKLGVNEVVGLKKAMAEVFKPVVEHIKDKTYWIDNFEIQCVDWAEYKSRDGFIPHSHNCGGIQIGMQIPRCEQYEFGFLEFGECDGCNDDCTVCLGSQDPNGECVSETEGHLDAYLNIWFKFEGISEDGELEFYINACGGNGDAPYFRVEHLTDIFEASFTCKSVKGLKRAASKHIKALLKSMGEK